MVVSKDSVRIMITIPISLKEELEVEAKNENRSLSNYIVTLIQKRNEKTPD
ncbi:ribbon-helix-helix domain-containing protein [Paenibacillus naphthalenovorans]|uniref:ribbon-helix-helix domain-containing protein n=1 Tax=Paenibacillus naphthalenovorans TaxID=162209 RepID=UPI003D27C41E